MKLSASTFSLLLLLLLALALLGPSAPAQDAAGTGPQESGEQELESFVPSEKLPADSAVSFPVDI